MENSQEVIHQMKTIGNLVPAEDGETNVTYLNIATFDFFCTGTEDVTIPNSELLIHISDAVSPTNSDGY